MTGAAGEGDMLNSLAGDASVLRGVFDQVPLIVISPADHEYRIAAANEACRIFLGRSDLVGLPVSEVIPDAGDQTVADLLGRVQATGQAETVRGWRIPLTAASRGPAEMFMDFTVLQWRSADGGTGLIAAATDATASVREREAAQLRADDAERRGRAARRYAADLRQALQPTGLPVLPRTSIAARYLIAGQEEAGGGDWFDAIPLAEGAVALVVGDVVGRGVGATAAIAQLRAVLTDLLLDDADLRTVLLRIDRLAARTPALRAATLTLALLDPAYGALQYVTCGHPAPLIISSRTSRFLPATPGGPLGTQSPRAPAADTLNPGDILLLYSDGLVERTGRPLAVGLSELASVAADAASSLVDAGEATASAADRVCQLTVELMARPGYADDVTTLAAERLRAPIPPLHLELRAVATSLTTIRRAMREWLLRLGPADDDQDGVHMAVVEIVTNAIEHAYPRGQPGLLEFDLALRPDGQLECLVSDYGAWRAPDPAAVDRGNGLMVAEHMVDSLLISHPADAGDAPPGAASTVVRILHRVRRPAMAVPAVTADAYRLRPGPAFAVHAQLDGAAARAEVRGPVDFSTAGDFLRRLIATCRGGTLPLVVDLTDVTYLASAGVSALIRIADQLRDHQNRLELITSAQGQVQDVLDLAGLAYRQAAPPARADA